MLIVIVLYFLIRKIVNLRTTKMKNLNNTDNEIIKNFKFESERGRVMSPHRVI